MKRTRNIFATVFGDLGSEGMALDVEGGGYDRLLGTSECI